MTDGNTETTRAGEPVEPNTPEEHMPRDAEPQAPQIVYGISIFELENREMMVEVTGDPDMGQLQRILAAALANLNADITARKVLEGMQALEARKVTSSIIRP